MSQPSPLLVWRKPPLAWCAAGISIGTAIVALPSLIPDGWLPVRLGLEGGAILAAFGLIWISAAAGLCALKGHGRAGLTRGDVVVCFPLAAFALIALVLVFGPLAAVAPASMQPLVYAIGLPLGVAALGGTFVIMWGLPFCALAAWLFSFIAFKRATPGIQ